MDIKFKDSSSRTYLKFFEEINLEKVDTNVTLNNQTLINISENILRSKCIIGELIFTK